MPANTARAQNTAAHVGVHNLKCKELYMDAQEDMHMNDYNKITALYSRLSVGDEDRDGGESNSIQNQKKFLESYARQLKLTNIRHYIDDDESGRFFDRSAYSRMIEDVENGKIGVCIMKDMTRWGRDYLQVGNAMEIFRRNNVRFIAVNNGIDSEKPDTLEFAPFINIMSEWYAKDISKKVKTGIKTKGMSGKPIATEAPYGYVKSPDNKDFWIIDEEAAGVVRLIFRLFLDGKNRNQIAVYLTQAQIPTPTFYMKERGRGTCKNRALNEDNRYKWNKATLTHILTRQEYCGDVVNFKTTKHLYTALIGYLHYEAPPEEQNFATLLEFLNAMDVREDDETYENPVDKIFKELQQEKPDHFAVRQYVKFKMAAGKTLKSILVSCGARLAPFDISELREITRYDELELDTLGGVRKGDTQKTALFLIMSDTDSTFNFLISMIYTQLFNLLCEKADDEFGGRLPIHVRCLIDEAANIGQIPNLEKLVATIRSREISACLVLQAQSQLKAIYKDNADTIIGNMDSRIFLGGSEPTTLKELSAALGKETIDTFNTGESRGRETSHSLNYQKLGKELASVDELAVLDGGKCILQLRGVRPFLSDKYDITKHPNYKYLSDAAPRNAFDIEKFLSTRLRLKQEEVYDCYEIDMTQEDAEQASTTA